MTFQEIINQQKPVLVDFHATWCQPCHMQAPILEQLKNKMGDQIIIIKIDIDKNQTVANHYQIRSVPTLIIFKENKILWKQSGVFPLDELEKIINPFIA